MNQIFTAGYSGHTPNQLKTVADSLGAFIVDIRFSPRSRVPGWDGAELSEFFGNEIYNWLPRLGNRNYKGGSIQIANLSGGMIQLGRLAKERSCILLCGCADYATCHRKHVADVLAQGGWNVQEIEWPETEVTGSMRAISVWQPYASLIAIGAKKVETRGWATSYRGPIAIHAAKRTSELYNCAFEPFWDAFEKAGVLHLPEKLNPNIPRLTLQARVRDLPPRRLLELFPLPLGAVVATAELVDCRPTESFGFGFDSTDPERHFGDYSPGRFGWVLENVKTLPDPVAFRGAQGFFSVDLSLLAGAGQGERICLKNKA